MKWQSVSLKEEKRTIPGYYFIRRVTPYGYPVLALDPFI